jgi:hypothetical protein
MKNKRNRSGMWEHAVIMLGILALMGFLLATGASARPLTAATFNNLSITPGEFQFTIKGFLYNESTQEPITSGSVEAYCNGQKKLENITDEQGGFSITGGYDICALGSDVVLKTNFEGDEYLRNVRIPDFVILQNKAGGGSGNSKKANPSVDSNINLLIQPTSADPIARNKNILVPEFTTLTLAITILLGGLGLALLRKQL